MRKIRSCFSLIAIIVLLPFLTGCAAVVVGAAVGVGSYVFIKGKLEQDLAYTVEEVHEASLFALKDMDVYITADGVTKRSAYINFTLENGKKGVINIKALTELKSRFSIRVGTFGNEEESFKIYSKIEEKL